MTSVTGDGRVEFRFYRPGATDVRVVGDHTRSQAGEPMASAGDGWWTVVTKLACGEYRFGYVADGCPYPDYAAFGVERTDAGAWQSVLVVRGGDAADRRETQRKIAPNHNTTKRVA